ncbi:MAG: hypothetical protein WC975_11550 [Phycisphaerae bacterium]
MIHWPKSYILVAHKIKNLFAFLTHHYLFGIPLDLPFRFVLLGAGYLLLQRKFSRGRSAAICITVLLIKETFDLFAVQRFPWPKPPNLGDLADVVSGLAGIGVAEIILRLRRRWP